MRSLIKAGCRGVFGAASFRFLAMMLSLVMVGNSVALAAGQAEPRPNPAKLKQTLTDRGIGNKVEVHEVDSRGAVKGVVSALHEDSFEVTPKAGPPVTIQYAQVSGVSMGMSHRGRVWTWVVVGALVWVAVGIVAHFTT